MCEAQTGYGHRPYSGGAPGLMGAAKEQRFWANDSDENESDDDGSGDEGGDGDDGDAGWWGCWPQRQYRRDKNMDLEALSGFKFIFHHLQARRSRASHRPL